MNVNVGVVDHSNLEAHPQGLPDAPQGPRSEAHSASFCFTSLFVIQIKYDLNFQEGKRMDDDGAFKVCKGAPS